MTTSAALTTTSASTTTSTNATVPNGATPAVAAPMPRVRPRLDASSAVMRVTTARCDREAECNNFGAGRPFGDRDECANEIGHDVVGLYSEQECPGGVDAELLATCVSEVKAEPCGDGSAAVDRLTSCARDRLCASADPF